ncbi:MAG: cytochrome c biogenesis CcdA family protein, partial [Hyphomicrobiales bacterium]
MIWASLLLVLVLAVGLAAGVWNTPALLFAGLSIPLTTGAITLPTVIIAGLADGINPCAFTLLLLFAAAIATLWKDAGEASRLALQARIIGYGGAFIFAIFLTYLFLGTGLLQASTALSQDHLGPRIGALVSVFLGLWMIKDYLVPEWGPRLSAPSMVGKFVQTWGRRATPVAMFGLGILVGLCTVPCSGAIYLVVVSMLALQENFIKSYTYLLVYNVMFVVPLIGLLLAASARPTLIRLGRWNLHHRGHVRLGLGGSVVALGLVILATV